MSVFLPAHKVDEHLRTLEIPQTTLPSQPIPSTPTPDSMPSNASSRGQIPKPANRIDEFDGLRGIAVLAVLAFHVRHDMFFFGWAAVDLFFVLSGYLVTSIVIRVKTQPRFLYRFYIRRALRTWPIYYLLLLAVIVFAAEQDALGYFATFTQYVPRFWSDIPLNYPWYLVHTWTLALEEQFYLLWPVFLMLVPRNALLRLVVLLVLSSAAAREYGLYPRLLAARCDGFAIGAMLAILPGGPQLYGRWFVLLGVAAAVFLACGCFTFGAQAFIGAEPLLPGASILALEILFAGVVALCVIHAGKPFLSPLRARWLTYVGTISYGVYLFHFPLFAAVVAVAESFGLGNGLLVKTARITLVFVVPILSWHLIERPLLSLKSLLDYQQRTRPSELATNASLHFVTDRQGESVSHREPCCHVPSAIDARDSSSLLSD